MLAEINQRELISRERCDRKTVAGCSEVRDAVAAAKRNFKNQECLATARSGEMGGAGTWNID